VVDAIVTDPPYGVRAGARKSVHLPYKARVPGRDHFPHTDPYTLAECLADLLESAARLLRLGGRLVYFLPVTSYCRTNYCFNVPLTPWECCDGLRVWGERQ
jgi:tRNA (guanine10-N2)-methyltransferase